MRIDHVAIWTRDIERLKAFYERYFQVDAGPKYTNSRKGFESYFLKFSNGARLELMQMASIPDTRNDPVDQFTGYIHLSISVGSKKQVDALTAELKQAGYLLVDSPRLTGDGFYESAILDPDGNRIEITV
jgi:lactoylglutathione lyase